jgi:hypothetical protein
MKITFYDADYAREFTAKLIKRDFIAVMVDENFSALLPNWKFFPIHVYLADKLLPRHGYTTTFISIMFDYENEPRCANDIELTKIEMSFIHDGDTFSESYDVDDCDVVLNGREERFIRELIFEKMVGGG